MVVRPPSLVIALAAVVCLWGVLAMAADGDNYREQLRVDGYDEHA
jgi:hypothetical protein